MKKLKVLGLAAIAAGMFSLTSCLDGGGNTAAFKLCYSRLFFYDENSDLSIGLLSVVCCYNCK